MPTGSGVEPQQPTDGSINTTTELNAAPPTTGLRHRVLLGSAWTVAVFALAQALRLGSNLVLTRLLVPEVFGLMALANVFLFGLQMLSDVGIAASVIQNSRGDDPRFVNTAWTLQAVRGVGLSLAAAVIAWPASQFYGEPQLLSVLPVLGLTAAIGGFHSTALLILRRRLQLGRLSAIELATQLIGITVMIVTAWSYRSVWALVVGGIVSELFRLVLSHLLFPELRPRFAWDREAVATIRSFGQWIFLSSALFFFAGQADRLFLGRFASLDLVGIYSIAVMLTEAILTLVTNLTHGVLYPALSQVAREDVARLRGAYYRSRLLLDAISLPVLGILATTGSEVVRMLYDPRYEAAGWILQILTIRVAMASIGTPCETCLFALGHTRYGFYRSLARAIWVVGGIPLGWSFGGLHGLVLVIALSEIPVLAVLWTAFWRTGVLSPWREARAASFFGAGALIGCVVLEIARSQFSQDQGRSRRRFCSPRAECSPGDHGSIQIDGTSGDSIGVVPLGAV